MTRPLGRYAEELSKGKQRVYSSPCYYKDEFGEFHPIDTSSHDTTSTIGDIKLYDKGIVSVGVSKDGTTKYMGLRPDETQALGTEQLEFTPLNLNFTDLEVRVERSVVRQLVKASYTTDFKISYTIHSKGFDLVNDKTIEDPVIREAIDIQAVDLGEVKGLDFKTPDTDKPTIYIGKIIDNHIFMSNDNTIDSFIDLPKDFTTSAINWGDGSLFVKDNIVMVGKGLGKFKPYAVDAMFKNIIKDRGFCFWDCDGNYWSLINTSDITWVEPYFKDKRFVDVDYEDIKYSDFLTDFEAEILKRYVGDIQETGTYIEPLKGNFLFRSRFSKQLYQIAKPCVLDAGYKVLFSDNRHTLKDNKDGTYTYTKYASQEQILFGFDNVAFVDTTFTGVSLTNFMLQKNGAVFNTQRSASTADNISNSGRPTCSYNSRFSTYSLQRGFVSFDTSSIQSGDTITAASLNIYLGFSDHQSSTAVYACSVGTTLDVGDYGSSSGSEIVNGNPTTANSLYTFTLSSFGSINKGALTQYCIREKEHDGDNSTPAGAYVTVSWLLSIGDGYDPYMDITYSAGATGYGQLMMVEESN